MKMAEIEKLDGKTMDIVEQNIEQLKELFPSVFSEGKVQFNKLEELLGNYVVEDEDHYNFTWHGKRKAGRLAQTPSTGTLRPAKDESVDWDNTENLFIEGDNLEVLKLLQKSYHRQVKMIYIDPPYNTGNDFVYEDDFKDGVKNYLEMTGQVDSDGKKMGTNSSAAGRYHTNWLNMMYPRLKLARNLMRDDGVIFISIDDNEQSNLKKLCDEVFGEENFVNNIIWEKKYAPANDAKWLSDNHDFILCYAKNKDVWRPNLLPRTEEQNQRYINSDDDDRGAWKPSDLSVKTYSEKYDYPITTPSGRIVNPPTGRCWRIGKEGFEKLVSENRIWFGSDGNNVPAIKRFLTEVKDGITPLTIWPYKDVGHNQTATREIKNLFQDGDNRLFDTPKPTSLIKRAIEIGADEDSLIIDFFAGSGTTAHAVWLRNLEDGGNRKVVCVQLPEDIKNETLTVADLTKERIRRAGKKIKEENPDYNGDLGFKVFKLDSSNIKRWDADFDTLESDLMDAVDYLVKDRTNEDVLYELCLKLGLDLSIKIEEKTVAGKKLFILGRGYLVVCLDDAITMDLIEGIGALKDELAPEDGMRVVFKDDGFKDDVVKTNALQTLKRFGIDDIKSL
jgi:adenine-specific DNA-methyltransferase